METGLSIALLVTAFIGAALGLTTRSWDDTKKSLIKFTWRGWLSFSLAVIVLVISCVKTYWTQKENDRLKYQRDKVRAVAYSKVYQGCYSLLMPLIDIYQSDGKKSRFNFRDDSMHGISSEMSDTLGLKYFETFYLLQPVKSGTAFEEWDSSYVHYISGYYNSKSPYRLHETVEKWAAFIDMEDIVLADSIMNDGYLITLQCIFKGEGSAYFFEDEDMLREQQRFIQMVSRLWNKSAPMYLDLNKANKSIEE